MKKLFIFGVGGTGSRVIKALTFLLASGVKIKEFSTVVPIIIDPHQANEDLKRTIEILRLYGKIREQLGDNNNTFFDSKISTLSSLKGSIGGSYTFELENVKGQKFKHFIDYDSLDDNNKALADLLFSKTNLETDMDIGFVGNPNIGSIVLNQFKYSEEFKTFANNFEEGDRVFIISSIFGGTGASGFPIILKNIRTADQNPNLESKDFLKNAPIGALTVLPYFNVEFDSESAIQKSDWIQKTKSALSYYEKNVTGNKSVNLMYYIGDKLSKTYKNDPGDGGQKNDAHFMELVGALSVIDFANMPIRELACENGKAIDPRAKEYGIKEDLETIDFTHLGNRTEKDMAKYMIQFSMMMKHFENHIQKAGKGEVYQHGAPALDDSFFNDVFYRDHFTSFVSYYKSWLNEMAMNKRAFAPINLDAPLRDTIANIPAKKGLLTKKIDYHRLDHFLNKDEKTGSFESAPKKFINLMFSATDKLINEYFDRYKS